LVGADAVYVMTPALARAAVILQVSVVHAAPTRSGRAIRTACASNRHIAITDTLCIVFMVFPSLDFYNVNPTRIAHFLTMNEKVAPEALV
jgi:hypothetical protein